MKCLTWWVGEAERTCPGSLSVPWALGICSPGWSCCQGKHEGLMLGQAALPWSCCSLCLLSCGHPCCPPAAAPREWQGRTSAVAQGRAGGAEARLASRLDHPSAPLQAAALQGPLGGRARPAPFQRTPLSRCWLGRQRGLLLCRADLYIYF